MMDTNDNKTAPKAPSQTASSGHGEDRKPMKRASLVRDDSPSKNVEPKAPKKAASPSFERDSARDRVVIRLLKKGIVTKSQVNDAWKEWRKLIEKDMRVPLWRVLATHEELNSPDVLVEASRLYAFDESILTFEEGLDFLEKNKETFPTESWDAMVEHFVLPVSTEKDPVSGDPKWTFITHDPTRPEIHQVIEGLRLRRFEIQFASEGLIGSLISESFLGRNAFMDSLEENHAVDLGSYENEDDFVDEDALEAEISRSHLINLFEAALTESVRGGASDIHIYPDADGKIVILFRLDGELEEWHIDERFRPEAFLAVVKDNSMNVDRFDREMAQDGFIQRWIDDVLIRFRVSVLPIASAKQEVHAESIVIRVLDDRKVLTDLRQIGLLEDAYARFQEAIRMPHGMIILTGPTGSGKSTTLVAALHQVVTPKVNVLTVEDPVEYLMRGVRQIKLSHKLTLEGALRAILRHDPDVVMVGEMRDQETAELAIKLANTGHLTFSTLHTNDAPSAVSRLYKMGVEPFLIAYAINIVVAQRLIRKLCVSCRVLDAEPDMDLFRHIGSSDDDLAEATIYKANDTSKCKKCKGTGYKGRRAIAETMLFTDKIRSLIMASEDIVDEDVLRKAAVDDGMTTLPDAARQLVLAGETSLEEAVRVTGA